MNSISNRTFFIQFICHFKKMKVSRTCMNRFINISRYSTSIESEIKESEFEYEVRTIGLRTLRKKPTIDPFLKDMFFSKFNKELLAFPETLDKTETEDLKYQIKIIESVMNNNKISVDDKLKHLKSMKLFTAPATYMHGGFQAVAAERCKILETLAERDINIARLVKDHWTGVTIVKEGLSQEESDPVLSDVMTGNIPITFCAKERIATFPKVNEMTTKAYRSSFKEWTVTGEKIYKLEKDGYFVIACDVNNEPIHLLLVRPGAQGVKIKKNESVVSFLNTPATVIGNIPDGSFVDEINPFPFMRNVVAQNRLEMASISIGVLRRAIREVICATRGKFIGEKPYAELQLVQVAIGKAVCSLYAIESMVYFTAGLLDDYEEQDIEVEACLSCVYGLKKTFDSISMLINAVGMDILPESMFERLRDAHSLLLHEEQIDTLSIYAALVGLQHTSSLMAEDVKKIRNPFMYPNFLLKKWLEEKMQSKGSVNLNLHLEENLHPSFLQNARNLEYSVARIKYATERVFIAHGQNVTEAHRDLKRLADLVAAVFAATASVARASRAYCIGLHMSENEMMASSVPTNLAAETVKSIIADLENGMYLNMDCMFEDIATKSVARGESHFEHCLERVFF